ncbi:MAG: hypothetical protein PHI64_12720 [Zoogloea sp.]|uniref:hypothetical protein n=1 Tax=Zoogloea sp. TaxID=49181 RepID=UPI002614ABF2|nr:hypothetical protein [Zoogloea sp.]MDD2989812.1 hypothetical protein [Zoogloea sp.]
MSEITTDLPQLNANDLILAKEMAEALHQAYPKHLWAVTAEGEKGICTIRNLALSGQWGYVLHIPKIYSMSSFKQKVLRAGGEILERYRLTRGVASEDQLADLRLDHAGNVLGDKSK